VCGRCVQRRLPGSQQVLGVERKHIWSARAKSAAPHCKRCLGHPNPRNREWGGMVGECSCVLRDGLLYNSHQQVLHPARLGHVQQVARLVQWRVHPTNED